jgi:hypothetical protein
MTPRNSKESVETRRRGRRPGDPGAKRSDRLVLRVHPDLIDALNASADEAGLSRSLFIERILVSYIKSDPRYADMDHMGRRRPTPGSAAQTSLRSFEQRWDRFTAIRRAVVGDIPDAEPALDDYGRPEDGSTIRDAGPRPPVPDRLKKPGAPRIYPHDSGRRK